MIHQWNTEKPFMLHACCHPVEGFCRSAIYDLQRKRYDFIPNKLFHILQENHFKSISEIVSEVEPIHRETVVSYLKFLHQNDYLFFPDREEKDCFTNIATDFEYPGIINAAILDVNRKEKHIRKEILDEIAWLGCRAVVLRIFDSYSPPEVVSLLNKMQGFPFRSIEVYCPWNPEFKPEWCRETTLRDTNTGLLALYGAPENSVIKEPFFGMQGIVFTQKQLHKTSLIPISDTSLFSLNITFFCEAHHANPFYNRKICISEEGEVSNAPGYGNQYGRLSEKTVTEIIESTDLTWLWKTKKDETLVCRDCEYRYMCPDNRIPKKNNDGLWEMANPCRYNPFSATWQNT